MKLDELEKCIFLWLQLHWVWLHKLLITCMFHRTLIKPVDWRRTNISPAKEPLLSLSLFFVLVRNMAETNRKTLVDPFGYTL